MDTLLAEINAKRKAEQDAGPSRKYMRRGDLEAEQEAKEAAERAEAQSRRERLRAEGQAVKMRKEAESAKNNSLASLADTPDAEGFNIGPEECIRRLRAKAQPIRLFGETDKDRRLRLRALELLEGREMGQNDFKRTLQDLDESMEEKNLRQKANSAHDKGKEKEEKRVDVGVLDLGLIKEDPNKLYPVIYYALKNVLKEWEEWMDARPEDIKRSGQGKMAAAVQVSSAQNLKPLFRQLRSRDMPPDVIRNMAEIVHHMQTRSYQKANDAYLRLSIGTAAWPIGVTSVGIHERSSQDKLYVDKIAHVLNDEVSRKWIQSVKRLLTFSQTVRPPKEISQMMG